MKVRRVVELSIFLVIACVIIMSWSVSADDAVRGGGTSAVAPGAVSTISAEQPLSCTNPQQCKEIDEVWRTIGPQVRNSDEIWDVLEKVWKLFSILYPTTQPSITYAPLRGPSAFDDIIRIAADSNQVEPALLKAIIKHESSFDPDEISRTGCVGLMQICTTSAKFAHIKKMSNQILTSGSDNELKTIKSCCPWDKSTESYRCKKEREACGNNKWCRVGAYICDPNNDDRFDPRKNILSGAVTLKAKIDSVQKQDNNCGIHCQIAAYNIGEGVVNAAIEAATSGATLPLSWDEVYAQITPELMKQKGYTEEEGWTDQERQQKRNNLNDYVNGIVASYNEYKPILVASR